MTIFASRLRSFFSESKFAGTLQTYFRSGWAFLIPYLAAYLLYAWLRWPVNPVASGQWTVIPCLLHVYWILHAIHLILGVTALHSWWRASGVTVTGATDDSVNAPNRVAQSQPSTVPHSGNRPPATLHRLPVSAAAYRLLPWLCLGLLFWIPGIYLEWPSDPWEHLRRINEWHILDEVTTHSSWKKSSYFLPYSLTGHTTGLLQLSWLNLYYTAVCLLLSWQYYRLARAVGLSEHASFIFVLLNALTLGNNIFSFYRYYGLSSSIFAQISAVALTRIALEALSAQRMGLVAKGKGQGIIYYPRSTTSSTALHTLPATPSAPSPSLLPFPAPVPQVSDLTTSGGSQVSGLPSPVSRLLPPLISALALLPLIALNHIQGIGIAGLGILAVFVWRLIEWKHSMIWWLAGTAVLLSVATVLWFPRHPAIDDAYRQLNWLTPWYGFNLFQPSSPAFDRMMEIMGAFGMLNVIIGLWLLRRNHITGWLTLMPPIALLLPCVTLPFSHLLATHSIDNIVTFHRMLFAVPMGLALLALLSPTAGLGTILTRPAPSSSYATCHILPFRLAALAATGIMFIAMVTSTGYLTYNRLWHATHTTAADLQLTPLVAVQQSAHRAMGEAWDGIQVASALATKVERAFRSKSEVDFRSSFAGIDAKCLGECIHTLANLPPDLITRSEPTMDAPSASNWMIYTIGSPNTTTRPSVLIDTDTPFIAINGLPMRWEQAKLHNSPGIAADFLNSELIPVDRHQRYALSATLRQTGNPAGVNYLTVAWYDANGTLLIANETAGDPRGWTNGTYSYFGLAGNAAPSQWSTYRISFGFAEDAQIPRDARYLRVGARLNYNSAPGTRVEIVQFRLQINRPYHSLLVMFPGFENLITTVSIAAQLSSHWTPSRVAVDHAGSIELRRHLPTSE